MPSASRNPGDESVRVTGNESKSAVDIRPVPDPTLLTTQQLLRELSGLKEVIFTRLDGMDRAISLFNENITRVPTDVDRQVGTLKELLEKVNVEKFNALGKQIVFAIEAYGEKFSAVDHQLKSVETYRVEQKQDTKAAVDAALAAAKEAVKEQTQASERAIAKSEAFTTKQIDAISEIIRTTVKGLDEKIDDLKTRVTAGDSQGKGAGVAVGYMIGAGGFLVAVLAVIIAIVLRGH